MYLAKGRLCGAGKIFKPHNQDTTEKESYFSNEDDQMNIFESDSAHSNSIEGKSNISLPDEQLEIFDTESAASNLDQLCVFLPEEQDLADTSNNILHESDVICLTSAKKSNTSILEQPMSCTERKNTSINVIANDKNSSFDSTVPSLLHNQRKKRKLKKIVNKILNRQTITNLVKELDKNNLSRDFLFSLQAMSNGDIPVTNIPHLTHLETMRFHRLPDSRCMWYSKKMKKIFALFLLSWWWTSTKITFRPKGYRHQQL